jgi:hypothetical protein
VKGVGKPLGGPLLLGLRDLDVGGADLHEELVLAGEGGRGLFGEEGQPKLLREPLGFPARVLLHLFPLFDRRRDWLRLSWLHYDLLVFFMLLTLAFGGVLVFAVFVVAKLALIFILVQTLGLEKLFDISFQHGKGAADRDAVGRSEGVIELVRHTTRVQERLGPAQAIDENGRSMKIALCTVHERSHTTRCGGCRRSASQEPTNWQRWGFVPRRGA